MLPLPASIPSVLGLQPVAWVPWESLTSLHPMQQLFPSLLALCPTPQQSYMASSTLGGYATLSSQQPTIYSLFLQVLLFYIVYLSEIIQHLSLPDLI